MTGPAGGARGEAGLVRAIGRWALTAVVINSVIGSGIFGLPAALTALAGAWSPLTVLIAGAGIFLVVLCFAEVGSRFDQTGGPYLYARDAFGPTAAFHVGWLQLWTRILSAAAVINVLAAYLAEVIPWVATSAGRAIVMTASVGIATAVNVTGVRSAAWTVNVFTIAKLLPLIALVPLGFAYFRPELLATQAVAQPDWTQAVLLLVFGYGGFENSIVAAGETRNPRRDTAFALIVAMLTITALYGLIQLVVVGVLPRAAGEPAPIAAAFRELLGPSGAFLGTLAVVVSIYGWLLGFVLTTPRIPFSMAVNGELPSVLGRVHAEWRTPYVAIITTGAVGLGFGLVSGFTQLATLSAVSRLAIFAATSAALIALRRTRPDPPPFRAPGGVATAAVAVAFCVWLLSTRDLAQAWILPFIILSGALIRMSLGRWRPSSA